MKTREGASSRAVRHCTPPILARSLEGGRESIIRDTTATTTRLWKAICSLRPRPTTTSSADNGPRHASQPAKGRKAARSEEWREGLAIIFLCDVGGNQGFCEHTIHTQSLVEISKERCVHHSTLSVLDRYVGAKGTFSLGSEKPRLTD